MEPPRAPRDVRRRARRRVRHAHAEPPPAPRRQHVHRLARGRPRARGRQGAVAARRAVRRPRRLRARDRGRRRRHARRRDRLRGAVASADESAFSYRDLDERSAAAMCFTSGTTGLPKGVVYSHRAIAIHALTAALLLGRERGRHHPPGRPDVPRERVVLPVHLLPRRREAGVPGPAPRPREPPRRVRAGEGHAQRGRADDLDGDPPGARRRPPTGGTCRRCGR